MKLAVPKNWPAWGGPTLDAGTGNNMLCLPNFLWLLYCHFARISLRCILVQRHIACFHGNVFFTKLLRNKPFHNTAFRWLVFAHLAFIYSTQRCFKRIQEKETVAQQCFQKKGLTQLLHSEARTQQHFLGSLIIHSTHFFVHNKAVGKTHLEHKTHVTGHPFYTSTMMPQWHAMTSNCPINLSQLERLTVELGPGAFLPCVSNSLSSTMACGTWPQGGDTTVPWYE